MSEEFTVDSIIDWAINYADYDELENVAKALYSIYGEERKKKHPEAHAKAKAYKKKIGKSRYANFH